MAMKFLIHILALLILTSCTPADIAQEYQMPTPPPNENPNSLNDNTMKLSIGNYTFTATLSTSATATAFKAMLPLTLNMTDFNSNEKVCSLPSSLTTSASNPGTIQTGDILLYGSSSLVLFYETFSTPYIYTRIGQIDNVSGLKAALGSSGVTITFKLK